MNYESIRTDQPHGPTAQPDGQPSAEGQSGSSYDSAGDTQPPRYVESSAPAADEALSSGEQIQVRSEAEEHPETVHDLTPPAPSEQGQGNVAEAKHPQEQPATVEMPREDIEAKMTEAKDIYERGQKLLSQGQVGEGGAASLKFEDRTGWSTTELKHEVEGVSESWVVMFQNNYLKAAKSLHNQAGQTTVFVTMEAQEGTVKAELIDYAENGLQDGPTKELGEVHGQGIIESVMSQLQKELELRELDAKKELDKKVADVLGLDLEHFSMR